MNLPGRAILAGLVAGWSSLVARWAHNPKVVGSNPAPATKKYLVLTSTYEARSDAGFGVSGVHGAFVAHLWPAEMAARHRRGRWADGPREASAAQYGAPLSHGRRCLRLLQLQTAWPRNSMQVSRAAFLGPAVSAPPVGQISVGANNPCSGLAAEAPGKPLIDPTTKRLFCRK